MPARRLSGQREHRRCLNFRFLPVPLLRLPAHRSADPHEFNPHEGEKSMSEDIIDRYKLNKRYSHASSVAVREKERTGVKPSPMGTLRMQQHAEKAASGSKHHQKGDALERRLNEARARDPFHNDPPNAKALRDELTRENEAERAEQKARHRREEEAAVKKSPAP
jgi:hypothetical protein